MKWRALSLAFTAAGVGLALTMALAQPWTDTQTSSGSINATTESAELYICEPGGVDCEVDDSGADEAIFEGVEDLYPGATASYSLRLRNVGTLPWDATGIAPAFVETSDPGDDCDIQPTVRLKMVSKNDNHITNPVGGCGSNPDYDPGLPQLITESTECVDGYGIPRYYCCGTIHVAPSGNEDVHMYVTLSSSAPVACKDNVWDLSIVWTATPD